MSSNALLRLTLGLASVGTLVLGWKVARARILRSRRKDPVELERLRRLDINRRGRIIVGRVVDCMEGQTAGEVSALVGYSYEVAGVNYEATQDVSALPEVAARARLSPGRTASVKYDPKRPANSIIACEEWNGLGTRGVGTGRGQ